LNFEGCKRSNTTAILIPGIIVENLHKIIAVIFENLTSGNYATLRTSKRIWTFGK